MLLRLLRLFPAFRHLQDQMTGLTSDLAAARQEIDDLVTENRLLAAQLETSRCDHDQLWTVMLDSLDNERFALRTQINHLTQKAGAGTPYLDAHRIPESSVPKPQEPGPVGRRGRVLQSQLARQQTIDNLRRMAQMSADNSGDVIAH